MSDQILRALLLRNERGGFSASVENLDFDDLPQAGDVLVQISFSCLNYKDALAVTDESPIVRGDYPFVPGIDLAGTVIESDDPLFHEGDIVISTGGGIGEKCWGGLSTAQRIPSKYLVKAPIGLSTRHAMIFGTAGVTAMLSVMDLENAGVKPEHGEVLVTGATGGVGSFSIMLLQKAGFDVVACTGKPEAAEYLKRLGATRILNRREYELEKLRPLDKSRWTAAVDTVGGTLLARVISQINTHGAVAVCGLAGGSELNTTVFPFILRGINLLGIDSNTCSVPIRENVWARMLEDISVPELEAMATEITLDDVVDISRQFLAGKITGRYYVSLDDSQD